MYATLDPDRVIDTIDKLRARIAERFPESGLQRVCADLADAARHTKTQIAFIQRPNHWLRGGVFLIVALGVATMFVLGRSFHLNESSTDTLNLVQGIEAVLNIVLLAAAGIVFLLNLESRRKRARAIAALQVLRGFVHVIDMHQLTKDPAMIGVPPTANSPKRALSSFELTRYLDYCTEMLSLCAKLAALYAQAARDSQIEEAASDLERLATNLSQKVWQKISIVRTSAAAPMPGA